jgi:DNA-binding LacI/PurR family transcriptional regulator
LRSGKSDVIGVVLADSLGYSFSDPMAISLLEGVSSVLEKHNKQLLLLSSLSDNSSQVGAESLPDGFIFYGTPSQNALARILNLSKPCVSIDFSHEAMPSVNINNRKASKEIAEYAITDKSDRVAIIGMRIIDDESVRALREEDNLDNSQEIAHQRLLGYVEGAKEKGVSIPFESRIHLPRNTIDYAQEAAKMLLSKEDRPNVILCMSDVIAMTVCRVANQMGIFVPEELKVTGFDDIAEATRNSPPLTTCSQQGVEKGIIATTMLIENDTSSKIVETKLRKRQSA